MTRRNTVGVLFGSALAIALFYNNCSPKISISSTSSKETIVGNPMGPASSKILSAICRVLDTCHSGVTMSECAAGVLATSGLDSHLGLAEGSYGAFSTIVAAEQKGLISAEPAATEQCQTEINNLSCSDPAVQAAYRPEMANPFGNVAAIIPTSPESCSSSLRPGLEKVYFSFDAESDPIMDDYGLTSDRWSDAQIKVARQAALAKNGTSALRHEQIAGVDSGQGTGKVIKFFNYLPNGGLTDAYYSAWFFIESGFDDPNPDYWKNNMQWMSQNSGSIRGGSKAVIGFSKIDGVRQVVLDINDCGVTGADFPEYDTRTYPWGGDCKFANKNPIAIDKGEWFHVEARFKAGDPSRLGRQVQVESGRITIWLNGQIVMDLDHPNLNTLTVFNKDLNKPNQWSDNDFNYFGLGLFASDLSQPPLQVIYTDDSLVTNYPVHEKLFP